MNAAAAATRVLSPARSSRRRAARAVVMSTWQLRTTQRGDVLKGDLDHAERLIQS